MYSAGQNQPKHTFALAQKDPSFILYKQATCITHSAAAANGV